MSQWRLLAIALSLSRPSRLASRRNKLLCEPREPFGMPLKAQFLKRLRKKAKKGMRGGPAATIAFYGPNLSQATKVAVGIVPSETAEPLRGAQLESRER